MATKKPINIEATITGLTEILDLLKDNPSSVTRGKTISLLAEVKKVEQAVDNEAYFLESAAAGLGLIHDGLDTLVRAIRDRKR